ncbi:MAG TPA: hypothetical protein VGV89_04120 [Thermoplasmata archaeon]|nr:hypothetical protein [Thermoplasmata archaeon]
MRRSIRLQNGSTRSYPGTSVPWWATAATAGAVLLLVTSALTTAAPAGSPSRAPPVVPTSHSWSQVSTGSTHPPGLVGPSMAYDPTDGYVVLFGGMAGGSGNRTNETWTYHAGVWTQLHPRVAPSPRAYAAMAWDGKDGYLLLEGGVGCGVWAINCNDTWSFVGGNWTSRGAGPPTRYYWATMAYNAAIGKTVLFTGAYGPSETYEWSSLGWVTFGHTTAATLGAWGDADLAYDPGLRTLVLASGFNLSCPGGTYPTYCLHTWSYSRTGWTALANKTTAGPIAFGMAWDPSNHRMVEYPKAPCCNNVSPPYTLQLIGTHWINVSGFSPGARYGPGVTYDGGDGYLLMFGGSLMATQFPTTTWELL